MREWTIKFDGREIGLARGQGRTNMYYKEMKSHTVVVVALTKIQAMDKVKSKYKIDRMVSCIPQPLKKEGFEK